VSEEQEEKFAREQLSLFQRMAGVFANIRYTRGYESKHRGGHVKAPYLLARRKKRTARKRARASRKQSRPQYNRRGK
jgi:hypothetical protein